MTDRTLAEHIEYYYNHSMKVISHLNDLLSIAEPTDKDLDKINRCVEHLRVVINMSFWTTEDLTPFTTALAAATST